VIIWKGPAAAAWAGAIRIITAKIFPEHIIPKEGRRPPAAMRLSIMVLTLAGIIDKAHSYTPSSPCFMGYYRSKKVL
jgi:hypothetical protein